MKTRRGGPLALPLLLSLAGGSHPLLGAQGADPSAAGPERGRSAVITVAVGVSDGLAGMGVGASLGVALSAGRLRVGLTGIDAAWIPEDPEPGYERVDVLTGDVLCIDPASGEFVDERHCGGFLTQLGAMADLSFSLGSGPRAVSLGGGYRVGDDRGPFLLVTWGPGTHDPNGTWYLQGRLGSRYFQGVAGISFRPWGRASPKVAADPGGGGAPTRR